jgi:hypothetical protein
MSCFVTWVDFRDLEQIKDAIVLGFALKQHNSIYPFVMIVNGDIPETLLATISRYCEVQTSIYSGYEAILHIQNYTKVLYMDPLMLPLKNIDKFFKEKAPAASFFGRHYTHGSPIPRSVIDCDDKIPPVFDSSVILLDVSKSLAERYSAFVVSEQECTHSRLLASFYNYMKIWHHMETHVEHCNTNEKFSKLQPSTKIISYEYESGPNLDVWMSIVLAHGMNIMFDEILPVLITITEKEVDFGTYNEQTEGKHYIVNAINSIDQDIKQWINGIPYVLTYNQRDAYAMIYMDREVVDTLEQQRFGRIYIITTPQFLALSERHKLIATDTYLTSEGTSHTIYQPEFMDRSPYIQFMVFEPLTMITIMFLFVN